MKTRTLLTVAALLAVLGIGWMVLRRSGGDSPPSSGPRDVILEVQIKNLEVRPAGDHAQLVLTGAFDQNGQTPIRLEPPMVRLLQADGTPVPRFIGPMLPEPVLPGAEPAEVTLHYWLPLTELKTPLTLDAGGRSYPLLFKP